MDKRGTVITLLLLLELICFCPASTSACTGTDKAREKFQEGGWMASYAKRLWDSQIVGTLAGMVFPPTAGAAAVALDRMIEEQIKGAATALAGAAEKLGKSVEDLLMDTVSQLLSGNLNPKDLLDLPDLDLKVNILRVNCENCINLCGGRKCKKCIASEGYQQLAFAYRLKSSDAITEVAPTPADAASPAQVCKHNCKKCGKNGLFGGCKKCCWDP